MSAEAWFGIIFFFLCIVCLPAMWSSYATPNSWFRQLIVEMKKLFGGKSDGEEPPAQR